MQKVICVGSLNPGKIDAVSKCLSEYKEFAESSLRSISTPSYVSDQPIGLEEMLEGARNRAMGAHASAEGCLFGVGLESGVVIVGELHFDVCACALYDGAKYHVGLSSAFVLPQGVVKAMFHVNTAQRIGYNDAFQAIGIPSDENGDGVVASMSNGILTRPKQMAQSVHNALLQYRNQQLYLAS